MPLLRSPHPSPAETELALRTGSAQPITGVPMGVVEAQAERVADERLAGRPVRRWRPLPEEVADVVMVAAAAAIVTLTSKPGDGRSLVWAVVYAVLVTAGLHVRRLYAPTLTWTPLDDAAKIVGTTATVATAIIAARVLIEDDTDGARFAVRLWVFTAVWLCAGRLGMAIALQRLRRAGEATRNTLIVGAGEIGTRLARRLMSRPELGLHPVGFLDKDPRGDDDDRLGLPVLGASWDLEQVVRDHDVRHVVLAFSTAPHAVMLNLTKRCSALGIPVSIVPRLFENVTHRVAVEHVGGIPLLRAEHTDPKGWQFSLKYAIGRVLAVLVVALLLPVLGAIALAVRLSSPGPILFRQKRVGLDGKVFDLFKFRTMRMADAAAEHDAAWAAQVLGEEAAAEVVADDRRTRPGRFLRRWSLDELPQLFNIVRGDMAFIGPRPERVGYVRAFEQHVYRYGDRHRVRSGLTGWAQVNGLRGATSLEDRIEWDNFYIENWSFWLDVKILFLTLPAVVSGRNAE